jgi:hypothetical protein
MDGIPPPIQSICPTGIYRPPTKRQASADAQPQALRPRGAPWDVRVGARLWRALRRAFAKLHGRRIGSQDEPKGPR